MKAIIQILFFTILSIAGNAQLNNAFDSFEKQSFLAPASYSICVLDARGEKVYAKYEQKLLMPASSQKVLTTASAFCLLGENYQYNTQLAYSGAIANQKLNGDLFIIGSGDPTLGSKHFANIHTPQSILTNWKDAIKNSGINTINGNIIPDVSCFKENDVPQTWLWEDIGNYYGAAATGLNFMDNEYELSFNEDRKMGEACSIINASGLEKHYEFYNEVEVGKEGSGDNAYLFGGPFEKGRFVKGMIPAGNKIFSIRGAIPYPPYHTSFQLNYLLANSGIIAQYHETPYPRISIPPVYKVIHQITSPKLSEIIQVTNHKSINFYAEALLKTIGKERGDEGSTEAGVKSIIDYWKSKGLNLSNAYVKDGCGLSRVNAISTLHLSTLMHLMSKHEKFELFYKTLPVAGFDGTLSKVCDGEPCKGKIIAKSGTMERVVAYTGYVQSATKGLLSFSIIINNFDARPSAVKAALIPIFNAMAAM